MTRRIAFYVSGHGPIFVSFVQGSNAHLANRLGFGHCSRTALLIEAFLKCGVDATSIFVVTDAIQEPFETIVAKGIHYRRAKTDAGVHQPLAYKVDADTTRQQLRAFMASLPEQTENEVTWLQEHQIDIVYSDASFLPCLAAEVAKLPSFLITNFTFDSIYAGLVDQFSQPEDATEMLQLSRAVEEQYRKANKLFRYPGHIPMPAFVGEREHEIVELPLTFGRATHTRQEVLSKLGIEVPVASRILLLSFGGQASALLTQTITLPAGWVVLVKQHLLPSSPAPAVPTPLIGYPDPFQRGMTNVDLIGACDAVLGKLGYGTCSEAIGNGNKPFLYVPRTEFIEEVGILEMMEHYGHPICLSRTLFESGNWHQALCAADKVLQQPSKKGVKDGSLAAAKDILAATEAACQNR